ncbi:ACP S-malonyltransferase [Pedobacter sp. AW31-3R]|uniref:ACP S-malonyltransferase n=1 Tax=Pedobacter sp. AW31-3R TaxID=3445781 RepID=UPI003FA0D6AA
MKTVFLFPGQGSQKPGMLHHLPLTDQTVKAIFSKTEEVLGQPVYDLDTEEKLQSTQYVQICLLIMEVISAKRLLEKGIPADFVGGHSIGAFSAAVISGVLSFEQALRLVDLRGRLMQEAYPENYGMAALVGFTTGRLQQYIDQHNRNHSTVYLGNINAATQQVVAGETASLAVFIESLKEAGINKAKMLKMSVPSHCVLLDSVSVALKEQIDSYTTREPLIPYLSNHTGRLLRNAEAIKKDLWISVARTVKWYDGISLLYELEARCFIEMEPSGVLSKIAEETFPEATVLAMEENGLEKVAWLWKNNQQE